MWKQKAEIGEWKIVNIQDTYYLEGRIFNHPKLPEGLHTRTTPLERIDFVKGEAETHNTIYKLLG